MYLRTDDIWICWFGCCAFVKPSSPHLQTSDINASFGTSLDFSQNNLFIFQLQSSAFADVIYPHLSEFQHLLLTNLSPSVTAEFDVAFVKKQLEEKKIIGTYDF